MIIQKISFAKFPAFDRSRYAELQSPWREGQDYSLIRYTSFLAANHREPLVDERINLRSSFVALHDALPIFEACENTSVPISAHYAVGVDGTTYRLSFEGKMGGSITLVWWAVLPPEWEPLRAIIDALSPYLEGEGWPEGLYG